MNIIVNTKRLPAPANIRIGYTKVAGQSLITWNQVTMKDIVPMYNIYRGVASSGAFYKMNLKPVATNKFIDNNVGRNPNTTYWYKISTVYNDNGVFIEGPLSAAVQYQVTTMNRWFNKINERNMWILKNTGQLFDFYTRKYEGERCPDCYDEARGRAGQNNCHTCFGTGFVGGYEPMVQLYIRLNPAEESLDIDQESYTYNQLPGAWTITPIQIKNRDILISQDGTMYAVKSTYVNQAEGYYFHQELKLKTLEPEDNLYNIKRATLKPVY